MPDHLPPDDAPTPEELAQIPRPLPEKPGTYWALMIWDFPIKRTYRTLIFYDVVQDHPVLIAAMFFDHQERPWLHTKTIIPHDILEWGPALEFPEL